MNKLLEPLSDVELARLDAFLLERIDAEAGDEEDTGLISISGLDGLFTAIVSGPVLSLPQQWMPVVWGAHEPEWEDQQHFEAIITLMMRHLNTIAATLQEAAEDFEPLFLEDEEEDALVVDDWCEGYALGVGLAQNDWQAGGAEVARLLEPILAFSSATDWRGHELGSEAETEKLSAAITPNVRALYAFWRKRTPQPVSPWDKARKP